MTKLILHKQVSTLDEASPGPLWRDAFVAAWPAYRRWFYSEGEAPRPRYLTSLQTLRHHMPELLPLYHTLVELAGGGDAEARFLAMVQPPAYLAGCSQAVFLGEQPVLVRNYDYRPQYWDGVVMRTGWLGRNVLGLSDCGWGLLDGINDAGLCVSMAFGGRRDVGPGFGVPLLLRYILQVCDDVPAALTALARLPCHMSYSLTLLDRAGRHATAFLGPDRAMVVSPQQATTNHQAVVHWPEHAEATGSLRRLDALNTALADVRVGQAEFLARFRRAPVFSSRFDAGRGTLYTACYHPDPSALDLMLPGTRWRLGVAGVGKRKHIARYPAAEAAGSVCAPPDA